MLNVIYIDVFLESRFSVYSRFHGPFIVHQDSSRYAGPPGCSKYIYYVTYFSSSYHIVIL